MCFNESGAMINMFKNLIKRSNNNKEYIINIRRKIHQYAETGFQTKKTKLLIEQELKKLNIDFKNCGRNGVLASIGTKSDCCVLLRADMDALPIKEKSGADFAAKNGNCHACGHDLHTAMLIGAAKLLKEKEKSLNGTVKLLFQPAEETLEGCKNIIESGLLEENTINAALMIHVLSGINIKSGTIIVSSGGISAPSADFFSITVKGKSSHGSTPHKGIDALLAASNILINIQSIQSRELPSDHNSVLTVGQLESGNAANIIAEKAVLKGTLRTFSEETRQFIKSRIFEISENTAKAFRAVAHFEITSGCPTLLNNEKLSMLIGNSLKDEYGNVLFSDELGGSIGGSEDFSYLTNLVPSLMISLTAGYINDGFKYPLHHPKVMFDESILPLGSAVYAYSALKIIENKISGAI